MSVPKLVPEISLVFRSRLLREQIAEHRLALRAMAYGFGTAEQYLITSPLVTIHPSPNCGASGSHDDSPIPGLAGDEPDEQNWEPASDYAVVFEPRLTSDQQGFLESTPDFPNPESLSRIAQRTSKRLGSSIPCAFVETRYSNAPSAFVV
jgi:hypothetical protein